MKSSGEPVTTPAAGRPGLMRVADLAQRPGLKLESRNDRLSADDALFRGAFWHRELRRGLHIHASDVIEVEDFTATSSQQAGLSCIFLLEGEVAVDIGDRHFDFCGTGEVREGLLVPSTCEELFRRVSRGSQRVRHLVVSVTPEWLDKDGLETQDDASSTRRLVHNHLDVRSWKATPRLADLVRGILAPRQDAGDLQDLMIESAAVEIVAEALSASSSQDRDLSSRMLSARDRNRLRRAEDYIASCTGIVLVDDIARQAGTSASGLQRLFQFAHGTSVVEHIRQHRLERARRALAEDRVSVQEASMIAGYGSAANFATAFKRRFGLSPSDARPRSGRS